MIYLHVILLYSDNTNCFTNTTAVVGCRPEDLNLNGQVDFYDLVILLSEWDAAGLTSDLDGDGTTSFQDLLLVLSAWGSC